MVHVSIGVAASISVRRWTCQQCGTAHGECSNKLKETLPRARLREQGSVSLKLEAESSAASACGEIGGLPGSRG